MNIIITFLLEQPLGRDRVKRHTFSIILIITVPKRKRFMTQNSLDRW